MSLWQAAILGGNRPAGGLLAARRWEDVFSSTGDRTRTTQAHVVAKHSPIACWGITLAESLFATFFPADCRICGEPLVRISRLPVCETCLDSIHPISGGVCGVCGERLVSPYAFRSESEARCGLCRRLEQPYVRAAAYGSYEGGLRDLIHMLKYQQVRPAANVLGRMLAEVIADLESSWGEGQIVVVPVPLFAGKLRQRGFNQAELVARAALKLTSARERFILEPQLLARVRETQSQIGLTRHQRRENLRGAFQATDPRKAAGREILLVDDVFTTGTTASECSRTLRKAGASRVWVATVARTLKHEVQAISFHPEESEDQTLARAAHG